MCSSKEIMPAARLRELSKLFSDMCFEEVHVSGGEPTSHAEFDAISRMLRSSFTSKAFMLFTNGYRLVENRDAACCYDRIYLSHYPGLNDSIMALDLTLFTNVIRTMKTSELKDVKRAKGSPDSWHTCPFARWVKLTSQRIWRCCDAIGIHRLRRVSIESCSVAAEPGWKEQFMLLNLSPACRMCPFHLPK